MLPWYERDASGVWTGREWATEPEARAEVAPGCTVHQETSARVGRLDPFTRSRFTQWVSSVVRRDWKPRGFGGTG